jgi:hypothetical protein
VNLTNKWQILRPRNKLLQIKSFVVDAEQLLGLLVVVVLVLLLVRLDLTELFSVQVDTGHAALAHLADEPVVGLEAVHKQRQKVPRAHPLGQHLGPLVLQQIDDACDYNNGDDDPKNAYQYNAICVCQREGEHDRRNDEERQQQVGKCKPPVLGRDLAKLLAHGQRPAHERQRVEDEDARDVEEKVAQRYLHCVLDHFGARRERRQYGCGCRADVGAQAQRVHAVHRDDSHADERRQCRGEHRRRLHEEGGAGADQDGQVARQPGHVRNVGVDCALDHHCHWTCWDN